MYEDNKLYDSWFWPTKLNHTTISQSNILSCGLIFLVVNI